jgi:hypothetical protein
VDPLALIVAKGCSSFCHIWLKSLLIEGQVVSLRGFELVFDLHLSAAVSLSFVD